MGTAGSFVSRQARVTGAGLRGTRAMATGLPAHLLQSVVSVSLVVNQAAEMFPATRVVANAELSGKTITVIVCCWIISIESRFGHPNNTIMALVILS